MRDNSPIMRIGVKVHCKFYQVQIDEIMFNTYIKIPSRDIDDFPLSIVREPNTDDYKPQGIIKSLNIIPIPNEPESIKRDPLEGWH